MRNSFRRNRSSQNVSTRNQGCSNNSNIVSTPEVENEETIHSTEVEQKKRGVYSEYRDGYTKEGPVQGRKYTVTHSDETGDLFVTIGNRYADDRIDTKLRDEVKLKWIRSTRKPALIGSVLVDGDHMKRDAEKRKEIFMREMPVALRGIREADDELFQRNPNLDRAQIIIGFESANPLYQEWISYGTMSDYKSKS